jgi:hypothetical protein
MLRFNKIQGCLSPTYEIISENKTQNVLRQMKSNFVGSTFNVYEQRNLAESRLIASIFFQEHFSFKIQPRNIEVYLLKEG